jgi:hypothetical protein
MNEVNRLNLGAPFICPHDEVDFDLKRWLICWGQPFFLQTHTSSCKLARGRSMRGFVYWLAPGYVMFERNVRRIKEYVWFRDPGAQGPKRRERTWLISVMDGRALVKAGCSHGSVYINNMRVMILLQLLREKRRSVQEICRLGWNTIREILFTLTLVCASAWRALGTDGQGVQEKTSGETSQRRAFVGYDFAQ